MNDKLTDALKAINRYYAHRWPDETADLCQSAAATLLAVERAIVWYLDGIGDPDGIDAIRERLADELGVVRLLLEAGRLEGTQRTE